MDYNQIVAQQQQVIQNVQAWMWVFTVIQCALFILGCWVLYMFYARLRDIGIELQKLRIAYEFANAPEKRSAARQEQRSTSACPEAPKPLTPPVEDTKYKPKS
jgi:hypothetical protein